MANPTASPLIRISGLTRTYSEGGQPRRVLDQIDLDIQRGEFFVMLGKSGSGKSTLLNLISGVDKADGGQVWVDGTEITGLDERRLTLFRRDHIGIVFQFFNLIPTLTVLENVTMPVELGGGNRSAGRTAGLALLERVGLADRADAFPDKLSGGEQQRVAIARALVRSPKLVLADEPTGNLDDETGEKVLRLLLELTREAGKTLVMATHNPEIVRWADRVGRVHDGKLVVSPVDEKFVL
ncbi:MAG: ABC transporter ATP-binding protein [Anaerolineae bacterium]|jgi:putative ABC transport system ATP-binding protein|nr:ABC transporter ATP-binding protein [Anaerolineae bacterium]